MAIEERDTVQIQEVIVLSKFEGEPLPENEVERVHIKDGNIVAVEKIKNGVVIASEIVPPGTPLPVTPRTSEDKGVE